MRSSTRGFCSRLQRVKAFRSANGDNYQQRRAVLLDRRKGVPHLLLPCGPRAVARMRVPAAGFGLAKLTESPAASTGAALLSQSPSITTAGDDDGRRHDSRHRGLHEPRAGQGRIVRIN
jgi:hypothetical protein